jgi:hypothetical protein
MSKGKKREIATSVPDYVVPITSLSSDNTVNVPFQNIVEDKVVESTQTYQVTSESEDAELFQSPVWHGFSGHDLRDFLIFEDSLRFIKNNIKDKHHKIGIVFSGDIEKRKIEEIVTFVSKVLNT